MALIAGIDGDTTRKEWLDMGGQVQGLMQLSGVETSSTKRDEEKILLRDLNWWKWSKSGLTAREIADKWEEPEGKAFAEDTRGAAIRRIDGIMRPVHNRRNKTTKNHETK